MITFSILEYTLITLVVLMLVLIIILSGVIKKLSRELLEVYDNRKSIFFIMIFSLAITTATAQSDGENIFKQKCTACHTIGKGKLVGPDLSGVTSRREEAWLKRQIKTPDVMIAEKDPIVMKLLEESNNVPMAPLGLSDAEVAEVIVYLKSTEQQAAVATGIPSEYMPTILISIVVLLGLTFIGLKAGKKKVDVR